MFVLSLFPGVDLLGRGFEAEGYCVVRGPDLLWGGDAHQFVPPRGRFEGVIGGSPCQDFTSMRRRYAMPPTGYGEQMLVEFMRIVREAAPDWFLLENVPGVPNICVAGYVMQRFTLNANECGALQNRQRKFQFGSTVGLVIVPARLPRTAGASRAALASEGERKRRRGWADFCELQGLPRDFDLPGMTISAKYRAIGNGVHVAVARTVAKAISEAYGRTEGVRLCPCECGRIVRGKGIVATAACRKRMQRARDRAWSGGGISATIFTELGESNG